MLILSLFFLFNLLFVQNLNSINIMYNYNNVNLSNANDQVINVGLK